VKYAFIFSHQKKQDYWHDKKQENLSGEVCEEKSVSIEEKS